MTKITNNASVLIGTSECGRVVYASCNDGPVIDGRDTWRGYYLKPAGTYTIQDGAADMTARVAKDDWALACQVMSDVDAAIAQRAAEIELRSAQKLDAMAAAIPDQMTRFFDANSDL